MPKIVDHEKRREDIVQAAREVVLASGSAGLTLRRLAQHMGVANGALRLYFATKSEVLEALLSDAVRRIRDEVAARGYDEQRGLRALRTMYALVLPRDEDQTANVRVLLALQGEITTKPELATVWTAAQERILATTSRHVREAIDDGDLDGDQPAEVTSYLLTNFALGRLMAQLGPVVTQPHDPTIAATAFEALLDAA